MSDDAHDSTQNPRFYVAEGDNCFRLGLFVKAVQAYSKAIDIRPDRNVYISRSKCYVALGQSDLAIQDATESIGTDTGFYRGYYQKAEAFYSAGNFEEALVNYYRAYRRRSDVEEYRLGVQKAEESILRAIDAGINVKADLSFEPRTNLTLAEISELYRTPDYPACHDGPDAPLQTEEFRCLCGCRYCDPSRCMDLQCQEEKDVCQCQCEACLHHVAYKHNHILDPITHQQLAATDIHTSPFIESESIPLTGSEGNAVYAALHALTTTSPSRNTASRTTVVTKKAEPTAKKYRTSGALAKDRAFLEGLKNDHVINATCSGIKPLIDDGIEYIDKRSEFWKQQGTGSTQSGPNAKVISSRKTPTMSVTGKNAPSMRNTSSVAKGAAHSQALGIAEQGPAKKRTATITQIAAGMNEVQELIRAMEIDDALTLSRSLERQCQDMHVNLSNREAVVEHGRLMSDIQTCIGCLLFATGKEGISVQRFRKSLTLSTQISDAYGVVRSNRNLGRVLLVLGDYKGARLFYEKVLKASHPDASCPPLILADAYLNAAKSIIDSGAKGPAYEYLKECLRIATVDTFNLDDPSEGMSLLQKDDGFEQFLNEAPSFFLAPEPTPSEITLDALCLAGKCLFDQGDIEKSELCLQICLAKARELRDPHAESAALINLSVIAANRGDVELATRYQDDATRITDALEHPQEATPAAEPQQDADDQHVEGGGPVV